MIPGGVFGVWMEAKHGSATAKQTTTQNVLTDSDLVKLSPTAARIPLQKPATQVSGAVHIA